MEKQYYKRWLMLAPFGLVLIGAGLCVFGEALLIKSSDANFWTWFWWGTGGLAIVNAGISVVGQAIIYRVKYERLKDREQ